jgi:hypothetical protein
MSTLLPSDLPPDRSPATAGDRPRPPSGVGGPDRRTRLRHHLALAIILAAVLPVAGTNSVWSADEGALLYQASAVAEGRGWTFDHPFPAADPAGRWFPIHLSSFATDGGYIVLSKHTLLVRLVGFLHGAGGYVAVVGLSVVGALAAAAATARLAARIDRRATLPALWLAGIASPLFLSAYVAWAHTVAAALVGWALVWLTWPGRSHRYPALLAGAAALGGACLLRTEATLAAAAVTMALVIPALGRLRARRPIREVTGAATPAALAAVATVAGFGLDRVTAIGRAGPVVPPGDRWGGVIGRLEGFSHTWLRPDFSDRPRHLLLLGAAAAVIGAGIAARRPGAGPTRVVALLALGCGALLARAVVSPVALIPGLVVAFPLLFAGLVQLRRADLSRPTASASASFLALFWGAVLATQYRYGGGGEWGGRYFALGLPAAIALATPPLIRATDGLRGRDRRQVLVLTAAVALIPVAMGILGLRDSRNQTRAILDRVDATLADPGDGSGRPVVVTTLAPLGRWAWEDVDRSRWLLVDEEDLAEVGSRLRSLGVERVAFVTDSVDAELPRLARHYRPDTPVPPGPGAGLDRVVIPLRATD